MLTCKAYIFITTVTGTLNLPCFSPQSHRSPGFAQVSSVACLLECILKLSKKCKDKDICWKWTERKREAHFSFVMPLPVNHRASLLKPLTFTLGSLDSFAFGSSHWCFRSSLGSLAVKAVPYDTLTSCGCSHMSFINVVVISVYLNLMVSDVFEDDHGSEYLKRN